MGQDAEGNCITGALEKDFPSVASSVAVTVLWLFLFSTSGVIDKVLSYFSIHGPNWFADFSGIVHSFLGWFGVKSGPPALVERGFLGITRWDW